ncbi:MAG: PPOX class F420-dependent oxidoreductase [Chloroflexota bacterium]
MSIIPKTEMIAFLQEVRNAVVGTIRRDGSPQISPVWYIYENECFHISIGKNSAKYHNLCRDPRISICVDGGAQDERTVMAYGTVQMIDAGEPEQLAMTHRMIFRYIEDEVAAQAYEDSMQGRPSVLLIVKPDKLLTQDLR